MESCRRRGRGLQLQVPGNSEGLTTHPLSCRHHNSQQVVWMGAVYIIVPDSRLLCTSTPATTANGGTTCLSQHVVLLYYCELL